MDLMQNAQDRMDSLETQIKLLTAQIKKENVYNIYSLL